MQRSLAQLSPRSSPVGDGTTFNVYFSSRSGGSPQADALHGIASLDTVAHIQEALVRAFAELTSPRFGWEAWHPDDKGSGRGTRDVLILDLGPSLLGAAVTIGASLPYLTFNSRVFDATPDGIRRRRQATVAHELVHLLQFETDTYQYWPSRGRCGEGDPNWWLHEAVALATEVALFPETPECYPCLWDWATSPHRSMEEDLNGFLAAPFMMYLMRLLGDAFPASIYRVAPDDVESMRATELVETALTMNRRILASTAGPDLFASGYCVDAAFVEDRPEYLDPGIAQIVGPRARSDVFENYPVTDAAADATVNHLGCRYFEFRPPPNPGRLELTIAPVQPRGQQALRGELVLVGKDGQRSQQTLACLDRGARLLAVADDFGAEQYDRALLVVANCFHGKGWSQFDGLSFLISARIR